MQINFVLTSRHKQMENLPILQDFVTAQPVAQRHQMVSGSLALLFICLELPLGSRAAAPTGDEVL